MISKGCDIPLPAVVTESTDSSKSSVSVDVKQLVLFYNTTF
jgi:hypothetical protein